MSRLLQAFLPRWLVMIVLSAMVLATVAVPRAAAAQDQPASLVDTKGLHFADYWLLANHALIPAPVQQKLADGRMRATFRTITNPVRYGLLARADLARAVSPLELLCLNRDERSLMLTCRKDGELRRVPLPTAACVAPASAIQSALPQGCTDPDVVTREGRTVRLRYAGLTIEPQTAVPDMDFAGTDAALSPQDPLPEPPARAPPERVPAPQAEPGQPSASAAEIQTLRRENDRLRARNDWLWSLIERSLGFFFIALVGWILIRFLFRKRALPIVAAEDEDPIERDEPGPEPDEARMAALRTELAELRTKHAQDTAATNEALLAANRARDDQFARQEALQQRLELAQTGERSALERAKAAEEAATRLGQDLAQAAARLNDTSANLKAANDELARRAISHASEREHDQAKIHRLETERVTMLTELDVLRAALSDRPDDPPAHTAGSYATSAHPAHVPHRATLVEYPDMASEPAAPRPTIDLDRHHAPIGEAELSQTPLVAHVDGAPYPLSLLEQGAQTPSAERLGAPGRLPLPTDPPPVPGTRPTSVAPDDAASGTRSRGTPVPAPAPSAPETDTNSFGELSFEGLFDPAPNHPAPTNGHGILEFDGADETAAAIPSEFMRAETRTYESRPHVDPNELRMQSHPQRGITIESPAAFTRHLADLTRTGIGDAPPTDTNDTALPAVKGCLPPPRTDLDPEADALAKLAQITSLPRQEGERPAERASQ